jgi:hypothetical protein
MSGHEGVPAVTLTAPAHLAVRRTGTKFGVRIRAEELRRLDGGNAQPRLQ